jgi:hypothetical protein
VPTVTFLAVLGKHPDARCSWGTASRQGTAFRQRAKRFDDGCEYRRMIGFETHPQAKHGKFYDVGQGQIAAEWVLGLG